MKKIRRDGRVFYNKKVKQKGREKTYQFYNNEQKEIPFKIIDDGIMISLYHNDEYVYKTYSQKNNKWRMMDNIIEKL